eukprot:scaffold37787_cov153-Skeletonema_marinoi.AAC.9
MRNATVLNTNYDFVPATSLPVASSAKDFRSFPLFLSDGQVRVLDLGSYLLGHPLDTSKLKG